MCKHCENLVEDKEIVHAFMERVAKNLSEMHNQKISADDLEIDIHVNIQPQGQPLGFSKAGLRMLGAISKAYE